MLTLQNKQYLIVLVSSFLLGASPIALNGGSSPFDGGTITSQLLAPDGTSAGPAYSHSAEPGMGYYRQAANVGAFQAEATYELRTSTALTNSGLYWDATADISSSTSAPAIRGTDADTGIVQSSRVLDFVVNNDGIAGIRSSASGATYGGFCLEASNNAPCLNVVGSGVGIVTLSSINSNYWSGYWSLGADGSMLTTRVGLEYTFNGDTDTGLANSFASTIDIRAANSNGVQLDQTSSTIVNSTYMKLASNAGPPPAGDCDADAERGRMVVDSTNDRLYVCGGATRLWDYYTLVDDAGL